MKIAGATLQQRIHRGHFILTIAVLLTCGLGLAVSNWLVVSHGADRTARGTALILSRNLIAPLLFKDQNEIAKTLASIEGHPSFKGAVLLDSTGQVIAKFPDLLGSTELTEVLSQNKGRRYSVIDHGEELGTLILISRKDIILQEILQFFLVGLVVMAASYIVSRLISRLTSRKIYNPINSILDTTRAVRESMDYSLRVKSQPTPADQITEIQTLTEDFNSMLSVVEERNVKIAYMNATLEETVEARTQELKDAQISLIHSSRLSALGEMAAGLAHEINNPLAVISGKARIIKRNLGETGSPAVLKDLERIEVTTDRISKIIHGLRALSRDGSFDPYEKTKLNLILEDALDLSAARLKDKQIDLIVDPVDENLVIECRPTQIGQVLLNLLNNASDAIENRDEKWIRVTAVSIDNELSLSVTDSGPGISAEIRTKLMQPFFTTKEVGKGTGLGLSISRKIISQHGGTFEIDASFKNTRFVIRLPLLHKIASASSGIK